VSTPEDPAVERARAVKTVDHVCVLGAEKAAWFDDTEGNIL
jgi:hypothetical protein